MSDMASFALLKMVHLLGVVLFLGNIIVTAWWKWRADRTREPKVIAFAQGQVTATDFVFTLVGAILLAAGGYGAAAAAGLPLSTPWVATGHALFIASGLVWISGLVPLQVLLARHARATACQGRVPDAYWRLERWWMVLGSVAVLLVLAAFVVMVLKVGFIPRH